MEVVAIIIGSVGGFVAVVVREALRIAKEKNPKAIYVGPNSSKNKGKVRVIS